MDIDKVVPFVVSGCVGLVLMAVAANFALSGSQQDSKQETKSPVETGTMLLFTFAVYLVIRNRIGVVSLDDSIHLPLAVVGLILVAIGALANILGRLKLGRNWANQATVYEEQTLVTSGLYAFVRHPLYSSLIFMFVGASLAYSNVLALLLTFLIFVPAMRWRACLEEKMLCSRFPEYEDYKRRTGQLFPWRKRSQP